MKIKNLANATLGLQICQANRGPRFLAQTWVMLFLATVFVALRLYFRHRRVNAIGWDDYMIVLSLVSKIFRAPDLR